MASFFKSLAALMLSACSVAVPAQERVKEPAELVFARADAEIKQKTQVFREIFGDEHFDWSVDLDEGVIKFTSATKVVSAPVQVIGTYNKLDGSFLWGWDHPSVPEPARTDARLAHEFGDLQRLPLFMTRKVNCSEEQAWSFTAVALYLSGAQGAYRGPSGTTMVFMTFGEMTISPLKA